jgi:hypothetical protein
VTRGATTWQICLKEACSSGQERAVTMIKRIHQYTLQRACRVLSWKGMKRGSMSLLLSTFWPAAAEMLRCAAAANVAVAEY